MDLIEANSFYKILSYLPNNSINSVRQSNKSLYNKSKSYVLSNYQFKFNDKMVSRFYYNTYRNIRNIIVESIDCLKYFDNLKSITFEHYFNLPLKDSIPGSVTHLIFDSKFEQFNPHHVPTTVTNLIFLN